MLIYGLLIYISFLFLRTRKEKRILNIIFSKLLFSLSICYIILTNYLTYVMIAGFKGFIEDFFSKNVTTIFKTNIDYSYRIMNTLKQLEQPFFNMRFSLIFIIIYAVVIFTICVVTFLKTKENKNVITLTTTICLTLTFFLFS